MTADSAPPRRPPRRVLRGFLGILTGSVLAQGLALAAVPVLSRLYTPEDTAHYALLLGISTVLASFAGLRLDMAVPLPHELAESRQLFWIAILAPFLVLPLTGLFAGSMIVSGAWGPAGLTWIDYAALAAFVVVVSAFAAASQLAIRLRSYGVLGRLPVIQMTGTLTVQVAMGVMGQGRGLFFGGLAGRSLGIAKVLRSCDVHRTQIPDRKATGRLLRKYWRFPVIFAPSSAISALGANVPALMLPALFGYGPAGLYAMAVRVAGVPGTVLGDSAGQVFLGEFARTNTRASSLRVFFRWSAALMTMALAVTAAIWVLAPLLLPWLLGDAWSGTAELAQYAGLMTGAGIVGSPLQHVWIVRQRGLLQFTWKVLRLGATAGVIWTGATSGDSLVKVVASMAAATVLVYALGWIGCLWAAARPAAGQHSISD